MTERLEILNKQIPILEAKLAAMKRERKSLKAAEQMRRQRQDPAFNAKAARNGRNNFPILVAYNAARRLPWPEDSTPYKRYRALTRKGWTRELAIEKIHAEHA